MGRFFDGLISWSIHNRIVVLLGAFVVVVWGIRSASRASLDVLPDFMPPQVVVQTDATGMGTLDVEQLVTQPLEQTLLGTPSVTKVRSTSFEGLSVITLTFEDGVDIFRARQLVTERVQLARPRLPQSVPAPQLAPISTALGALLKFCLTSTNPAGDQTARALRTFADWTLRPRLLAIAGVAQVMTIGGGVERIEVRPDPMRMRQRRVSTTEVIDAVRASQSLAGGGFAESASARLDVRSASRFRLSDALGGLAAVPVETADPQAIVRLGDVSHIVFATEPAAGDALYDGRPAVYIQVNKVPWADTIAVTREVERALADLTRDLPPGAEFEPPVFRQASFIDTSITSVVRAILIGSILVIAVLVAFLRYGRLAIISLTAIPLSLVTALAVLVASGASINGMTLGGLAIAVGEVVDDAIVDVENVWRRLRENARHERPEPPLDIVRAASREIRGSVVYATIIVGLVLIPVLTLGGLAGRIFAPLALAYILAIGASLLVALTVTPALCAWLLPPIATVEARPSRFALAFVARYRRAIERIVAWPKVVLGVAGLAALAAMAVLPFLSGRFLPEFHERTLIAHINAAPGTSLPETVRIATRVDAELRPNPAVHVASRVGRSELDEDMQPVSRIEADLVLPSDGGGTWDDLNRAALVRLAQIPGIGIAVEGFLGERLHEVLSGETSPVVIKVLGSDLNQLRGLAAQAARVAAETPGLANIQPEAQIDVPQIRVRFDPAALARYGVQPAAAGDALVSLRQGQVESQVFTGTGRVVDIAVAGDDASRGVAALSDLPMDTRAGLVSLSTLATIDRVEGPALINHEDGERRITIGIDVIGGGLSGAVADLERRLQALRVPTGFRIEVGGEAVARRQAAGQLALVGGLVLIGIFVLLTLAFGSTGDAAITLLNFPLGLVGGVIGALLTAGGLSVAGLVGFVTLFGIIARNGIMLVAHKQHLDARHPAMDAVSRVLQASEERVLPIVMTAATAGLGLLPLALSLGRSGSELEAPMALIVCLGLVTSTALNMVVIPTVYVALARRRARSMEGGIA